MVERLRKIEEYPDYSISDQGRVWSSQRCLYFRGRDSLTLGDWYV